MKAISMSNFPRSETSAVITIKTTRLFRFRIWLAIWLLSAAGWLLNSRVAIKFDEGPEL